MLSQEYIDSLVTINIYDHNNNLLGHDFFTIIPIINTGGYLANGEDKSYYNIDIVNQIKENKEYDIIISFINIIRELKN